MDACLELLGMDVGTIKIVAGAVLGLAGVFLGHIAAESRGLGRSRRGD